MPLGSNLLHVLLSPSMHDMRDGTIGHSVAIGLNGSARSQTFPSPPGKTGWCRKPPRFMW